MTITRQATTLQSLAAENAFVPDRMIARVILDRHIKRGKLDAAELVAEIAQALAKASVLRGVLNLAAGDALAEHSSGSVEDYDRARALLDEIA